MPSVHIRNLACLMYTIVYVRQPLAYFTNYATLFCLLYTLVKIGTIFFPLLFIMMQKPTIIKETARLIFFLLARKTETEDRFATFLSNIQPLIFASANVFFSPQ